MMNYKEQQAYIAQVYERVFKHQETGTEEEITKKIAAKVSHFFAPKYEQWSNNIYYDYQAFLKHVGEVNTRSSADFSVAFLSSTRQEQTNIVTVRCVVTDSATGDFLSGVVSAWAFTDHKKMIWCKEVLFDTLASDDCGESQDPTSWEADVKV